MTLQQLKYVIAIVEKGSTNEAAKVLYLSQASLTKAIHEFFGNYANFGKWFKINVVCDELFTARTDVPSIQLIFINFVRPGFLLQNGVKISRNFGKEDCRYEFDGI